MATFTASIKINAVTNLTRVAKKIRKSTDRMRIGFTKLSASLKKVGAGFTKFAKRASVGLIAAGVAFAVLIKKTANYGDSLDKTTQKTGVLTKRLQELRLAVQLGGGSSADADKALRFLSRAMKEAADGSEEYEEVFTRLGIAIQDSNGMFRDADKVMLDFASVFSVMEDGAEKTSDSMAVMGRAGTNLIPFLNQGTKGFEDVAKRMHFFNTEADDKAGANFNDELLILRTNLAGLAREAAKPLLPLLTDDITKLDKFLPTFHKWVDANVDLQKAYEGIKTALKDIDFKNLFDVSVEKIKTVTMEIQEIITDIKEAIQFIKDFDPLGYKAFTGSLGEVFAPKSQTRLLTPGERDPLLIKMDVNQDGRVLDMTTNAPKGISFSADIGLVTP